MTTVIMPHVRSATPIIVQDRQRIIRFSSRAHLRIYERDIHLDCATDHLDFHPSPRVHFPRRAPFRIPKKYMRTYPTDLGA